MVRRSSIILSLTGLLISLGLWGMSYTVFGWSNGRTIISVSGGAVRYMEFYGLSQSPGRAKWWWSGFNGMGTALIPSVGWRPSVAGQGGTRHFLLPFWMPCALFATVSWLCYRPQFVRRRRRRQGQCVNCGYDLTGNVSGICPECARAVERS